MMTTELAVSQHIVHGGIWTLSVRRMFHSLCRTTIFLQDLILILHSSGLLHNLVSLLFLKYLNLGDYRVFLFVLLEAFFYKKKKKCWEITIDW